MEVTRGGDLAASGAGASGTGGAPGIGGPGRTEPDFLPALVGDGRPLVLVTALGLAISGGFAVFLSLTGAFLPHDVAFLQLTPEALCRFYGCRIVRFMIHDRLSFGGALLAVATLYAWLALFPLRSGLAWAWWTLALTGIAGFGSFLAYLGYGYLDTWHGVASLLLLPIFALGLWRSRALVRDWPAPRALAAPGWAPARWRSRAGLGRLALLGTGAGMIGAGATILAVGMTVVFVPEDLGYIGASAAEIQAINPRLVPLIAHDRAGFGGALLTTGLLVACIVWKATPSRHLWQALLLAGAFGFGAAIGVHIPIGYHDVIHLAPAIAGMLLFTLGLALSAREFGLGRRPGYG